MIIGIFNTIRQYCGTIYSSILIIHLPYVFPPSRSIHPFFFIKLSSRFMVLSEIPNFWDSCSLVKVLSSDKAFKMSRWRSVIFFGPFFGSFFGPFFGPSVLCSICRINFTCINSGCSISSGLSQCFSFHAMSGLSDYDPKGQIAVGKPTKNIAEPRGVEPRSQDFQSRAYTKSAKVPLSQPLIHASSSFDGAKVQSPHAAFLRTDKKDYFLSAFSFRVLSHEKQKIASAAQ
jgi:hypothetical protein